MKYRQDIDGLRGLAVLLVVAFHLPIPQISGGFVGVDIFFTISGFLITRLLWAEGRGLSLGQFYVRRMRRLLPGLFVTVVLTTAAAGLIMDRTDLIATMNSALLALASVSNFGFWLEAGYWDVDNALKPLLHTWSLGVEEQFYLLWPWLILAGLGLNLSRRSMIAVMGVIAIAGLIAAEWALDHYPAAAFYLMPFRITEFAIGALIAFLPDRFLERLPILLRQMLFVGGLIAIAFAATLYDDRTRFPGLASWLPCLAAGAIILAGRARGVSWLLTNPLATGLGRVSYSLYLVHWPLIVLTTYRLGPDLNLAQTLCMLVVMLLLAFSLHRFVEQPCRLPSGSRATKGSGGWVAGAGWTSSLVIALGTIQLISTPQSVQSSTELTRRAGNPGLITPERLLDRTDVNEQRYAPVRAVCPEIEDASCLTLAPDRANILILGDSQGVDGFNAVQAALPDAHIIRGSFRGCAPIHDIAGYQDRVGIYTNPTQAASCRDWNTALFGEDSVLSEVDIIVVSTFWRPTRIEFFFDTLAHIRALNPDVQILLLGNGTILNRRFVDVARDHPPARGRSIPADDIYPMTFSLDDAVAELASSDDRVHWVSRNAFFCPGRECAMFTPSGADFVLYDRVHYSVAASEEFGRAVLRPWLQRLSLEAN